MSPEVFSQEANYNPPRGLLVATGALLALTISVGSVDVAESIYPSFRPFGTAEATDSCPKVTDITAKWPRDEAEAQQNYDQIEFAMDANQLGVLNQRIDDSRNFDDVQTVLNDVFMHYNMQVRLFELPDSNSNITQDSNDVSLYILEHQASNLLQSLTIVPDSFLKRMHGTNIYLVNNLKIDDKKRGGLHIMSDSHNQEDVILDIDNDIQNAFYHEMLGHGLTGRLCGTKTLDGDPEIAKFNPEGFGYNDSENSDGLAARVQAANSGITVTDYAATSSVEDDADTTASDMEYGFWLGSQNCAELENAACRKKWLIVSRLSKLEPKFIDLMYEHTYHSHK